jgi:hypothetical protein
MCGCSVSSAGVPRLTAPDNLKSGVNRASFYDPEINRSYGIGGPLRGWRASGTPAKAARQGQGGLACKVGRFFRSGDSR